MKNFTRSLSLKTSLLFLFITSLPSCTNPSVNNELNEPVSVANYSTGIIGSWDGTIDGSEETMSLKKDSTFICHLRRLGFIANTLSQSLPGTINGVWQISAAMITMQITNEKNENVENLNASSQIISLSTNRLVLRSDKGDTCTFKRVSDF